MAARIPHHQGGLEINALELQRKLEQLEFPTKTSNKREEIEYLLNVELPLFTQSLQAKQRQLQSTLADLLSAIAAEAEPPPPQSVVRDILAGRQRYTGIPVPILAIFAAPHEYLPPTGSDPASRAVADVLREMNAFIGGLPR